MGGSLQCIAINQTSKHVERYLKYHNKEIKKIYGNKKPKSKQTKNKTKKQKIQKKKTQKQKQKSIIESSFTHYLLLTSYEQTQEPQEKKYSFFRAIHLIKLESRTIENL